MSALTDLFTSLANKIRAKLGTESTYTPTEAISAIDDVYDAGVTATKVGTATAGDVLSGKTFTNSSSVGASGSMTNNGAVSQSLNCGGSYTVPAGYHNGSGTVTANSLASQTGVDSGKTAVTAGTMVSGYQGWVNGSKISGTFTGQEKTVTAGTSAASVTPDSGKYLSKVTYNPTPSQSKSASPSTSAQTISPDSGKLLSSVSISAISPQRSTGTAATTAGRDSTGPYVYFPYGWWPNANTTYGNYTRLTEAQGVAVARKQEKTVTSSRSAQTVSPDSNYLLSKVTVNALAPTGTYTASSRGASLDMGATSNYRYVNTNSVPNTNSGTFTPTSNSLAHDMGATNTYRYVNTDTLYTTAYSNGYDVGYAKGKEYARYVHSNVATFNTTANTIDLPISAKSITITDVTYKNDSYVSGDYFRCYSNGTQLGQYALNAVKNTTKTFSSNVTSVQIYLENHSGALREVYFKVKINF